MAVTCPVFSRSFSRMPMLRLFGFLSAIIRAAPIIPVVFTILGAMKRIQEDGYCIGLC